eukprot:TRINITY_DN2449_c0_g1_i7.p1 TRINITY_DN2449_c0_g1~~TRINITY_DN2449_c0_g1_i7.p1  ORF type:complete len:222 (-),score=64.49 TRINITY_DN2449_c0_g1_i7:279-944(-)
MDMAQYGLYRPRQVEASRQAFIRRAADHNAVGLSRLLEPKEGREMAELNLNFERSERREAELRLMQHSRMIPLAAGRNAPRLSLLDSDSQRYLMDARLERQVRVDAIKAGIRRDNFEAAGGVTVDQPGGFRRTGSLAVEGVHCIQDDAIALFKAADRVWEADEEGTIKAIDLSRQMQDSVVLKKKYGYERWESLSRFLHQKKLEDRIAMQEWVALFEANFK